MKLLLVEDDPAISDSLKVGLAREGFTVDVAADGDDGWWMASEAPYDAIVLDILLPKRNGFGICRDLRAAGNWTPVLMLSAKNGEYDQIEALELGADDYLTKPFSFPLLVAHLHSMLRRAKQRDVAPTRVGAIRADSAGRRVWIGDVEVALTTREFDIFEFLLRRAGRVVSKPTILRGVWEFDFDGDPNIVEVYVGRLRRKLRAVAGTELIRTVHGAGYRIQSDDG
ncbi:MAG TPA: response regulator transcription factor [Ilumatobacter sp.]|nr:response regulator transcription factor [Ilumatobacter sp.]